MILRIIAISKNKLFLIALRLTPVVLTVVFVNILADPANLLDQQYKFEKEIAQWKQKKYNLKIPLAVADYDERIMHKEVISQFEETPNLVVMGSSRVRFIYSEDFPLASFYNLASAAANLEDYIAYTSLLVNHTGLPAKIILALDHWMIDSDSGYTHWQSINTDFKSGLALITGKGTNSEIVNYVRRWDKFIEMINPNYFQASIKRLAKSLYSDTLIERELYPTKSIYATEDFWLQRFDGTVGLPLVERPDGEVLRIVRFQDDHVSPLKTIDSRRFNLLKQLIQYLQNQGVKVMLILIPVHPYTYEKWQVEKKGLEKAEALYRQLATQLNTPIHGSYDPNNVNAKQNDFVDWVHPRRSYMQSFFNRFSQKEAWLR